MAKPEWGVKRVCQSCATKFYDLGRSPITCPKCAAPFDPEALLKSRRSRPTPSKTVKPAVVARAAPPAAKPLEADVNPDDAGAEAASASDDDGDDKVPVVVDSSDLGEDDVSEVVVPKDKEDS